MAEGGALIRAARKAAGLTQAQLAAKVGIGRETLSRIETGMIDEIGIRKYRRLCESLDLELAVMPRSAPLSLHEVYAQVRAEKAEAARLTDAIIAREGQSRSHARPRRK